MDKLICSHAKECGEGSTDCGCTHATEHTFRPGACNIPCTLFPNAECVEVKP